MFFNSVTYGGTIRTLDVRIRSIRHACMTPERKYYLRSASVSLLQGRNFKKKNHCYNKFHHR